MSNLYEAVQKGEGELAELLPQVLEEALPRVSVEPEESAAPESKEPVDEAQAAVRNVLGELEAPCRPALLDHFDSIRQLPIHLASGSPLLPFDDTHFVAAEQYRVIRTRLIQHPKQPRMILISSGGPGDGKSVTAVNIAGALSLKSEAKVLLADIDLRRSTVHKQLGLSASPGLADVLAGTATLEQAVIRTEQFPNLYVIPAGEPFANPSELLDSARWYAICEELRSEFRYVIADSPPVATVADYELLQASCDGVVLVVRPDHTKRQACLKALEIIPKEKLIGVVMNCVEDWFLARREAYTPPYYYYGKKGAGK